MTTNECECVRFEKLKHTEYPQRDEHWYLSWPMANSSSMSTSENEQQVIIMTGLQARTNACVWVDLERMSALKLTNQLTVLTKHLGVVAYIIKNAKIVEVKKMKVFVEESLVSMALQIVR